MTFSDLLHQVSRGAASATDAAVFSAVPVPKRTAFLVARSARGNPALLVRTGAATIMPVRLSGIEAHFGVACQVQRGSATKTERLSFVECLTVDPDQVSLFAACMDILIGLLGASPTAPELAAAVARLVTMFQALATPPQRDVTGVIGELCVILAARDCGSAVRAWHAVPVERYDFVAADLRMDAKATAGRNRVHRLTVDQANPPPGTIGILASVLVRRAGGGVAVSELIERIERRLSGDFDARLMLQEGLVGILGSGLQSALNVSFDLDEALSSIRLYRLDEMPAIRPPLPSGVFDVSFSADLDECAAVDSGVLDALLQPSARNVLPELASAEV